ncbi:2-dehydro-3-deoxygalactonokinase [Mucilaginibacter flavidus]|uniref:2-dehydro-3-deoxygalactonokinase n=1 Tax=Mucilaginibacter flavidus TaxID=2949309 RepID=UPI002092A2CA|nr:2-dehydro-3-deoxygalactonokinase [Mucilaginibacter flavidus]MCO5946412.1 2-dehydro-3-deoxygalactonokinase [Mucilaginibacter flavidus]
MNYFLSCDWGTSALRLMLVDAVSGEIIARESSDQGIADTFAQWKTTESPREVFYLDVLSLQIIAIEKKLNLNLDGVPVIASGMASSSIGIMELPYSELPFDLSGSNLTTHYLPATAGFNHKKNLVSGVKSADDVMRGEETQLIGCIDPMQTVINDEIFIFPGTHSKHIRINKNQVTAFKTFMTGDFFELLSQKSILSGSVEKTADIENPGQLTSFKAGVEEGASNGLLSAAFRVRTNNLFTKYNKAENFNFLSGLLIGAELTDPAIRTAKKIHLLCGSKLAQYYPTAFECLGLSQQLKTYPAQWVDDAVARAHFKIYHQKQK